MKCLGRTKTSNFRHRCGQPARFLFCWQHIWQPFAALAVLVAFCGGLAELSGFSIRDIVGKGSPTALAPDIKVYFSACEPESDFELSRGGRTLLFVSIPRLTEPINRLVFGTAIVRPVNTGSRSMADAQLTTIFADRLWDPSLGILDRDSVTPISGAHEFDFRIQRVDRGWIATRKLPRLDPMTGAPCPVSFLLQVHGVTPQGEMNANAEGEMKIMMFGPDWVGLNHVLDIRCIPADSAETFVASSRAKAASLRAEGYPDVPVILAFTGGRSMIPVEHGPAIIQARIHAFIVLKEAMLHDF